MHGHMCVKFKKSSLELWQIPPEVRCIFSKYSRYNVALNCALGFLRSFRPNIIPSTLPTRTTPFVVSSLPLFN